MQQQNMAILKQNAQDAVIADRYGIYEPSTATIRTVEATSERLRYLIISFPTAKRKAIRER